MTVPATRSEAFVYCWTNHKNNMIYVGVHKGHEDDGYICSSKKMLEDYNITPDIFTRQIIANGTFAEMRKLESAILRAANAARSADYYNQNNNDGSFFCLGHSEETKIKMSRTWKNKKQYNCSNELAIKAWRGSKHTNDAKRKMSLAGEKYSESRSLRLKTNNPMKDPTTIAKMLETRKKNKEAKRDNTNRS